MRIVYLYLTAIVFLFGRFACVDGLRGRKKQDKATTLQASKVDKFRTLFAAFLKSVDEAARNWNYEKGEPECYWTIGWMLFDSLRKYNKLNLAFVRYKLEKPSVITIDLNIRSTVDSKLYSSSAILHLTCPTSLHKPQFIELIKAAIEIEGDDKAPNPDSVMEMLAVDILELDREAGQINLQIHDQTKITIFDAPSALKTVVLASGSRIEEGDWLVKVSEPHFYSIGDMDEINFVNPAGNQVTVLQCTKAMMLEGTKHQAIQLNNFLHALGPFHFRSHPPLNVPLVAHHFALPRLRETKIQSLVNWLKYNKEHLAIDPIEEKILTGRKTTLMNPRYAGVVFTDPVKEGYFIFIGGNGIGFARFTATEQNEEQRGVFAKSPFLYHVPREVKSTPSHYKWNYESVEVAVPKKPKNRFKRFFRTVADKIFGVFKRCGSGSND